MNKLVYISILSYGVIWGMNVDRFTSAKNEILAWMKVPCQEEALSDAERAQLTKSTFKLVRPGMHDYSWLSQFIKDCNGDECVVDKMGAIDRVLVCHTVDAPGLRLQERQNLLMAVS